MVRLPVGPRRVSRAGRDAARLGDRGLSLRVWINPYIAQRSPLFAGGQAHGLPRQAGPNGSVWQWDMWQPAWDSSTSRTRPRASGSRANCARCSIWAWTRSRPTSASGSRRTSCISTAPTRTDAQLLQPALQPDRVRGRRRRGEARPCCSPARPPRADSSFRSTGAATASRPTCRWPSRCAAASRSGSAASASGATTSAASRARRRAASSSAGSLSACCPRTAGCTARAPIACRGRSTRRPSRSRARSPA